MTFASLILSFALTAPGGDSAVREALKLFANDPPVTEVQRAALEHFSVSQDDLSGYRTSARLKALMPSLTGSYTQDDTKLNIYATDRMIWRAQAPFDPDDPQTADAQSGLGRAFSASVTWNLASLVFDSNQLETYALVGIHEDLLKEVTRLYYTRQHNMLALALDPPKDPRARAALLLRTREIEAMLDALTGGAWSRLRQRQ
ncbi:hypothetical protein ACFL6C_02980 [Myxococcota bacterium]